MQIKVVVSSRHHRSHGVTLGVGDSVDFGLKDTNKIQCLLDPLLLWTMADFNICTAFFTLPWTCEYSPGDGYSWFKGPDDSHEYNNKPSTFEAMVRARTSLIWKMSCVVFIAQLPEHPVATVTIGLVVSARFVAIREGGI